MTSRPLELIHTDLCGPAMTKTLRALEKLQQYQKKNQETPKSKLKELRKICSQVTNFSTDSSLSVGQSQGSLQDTQHVTGGTTLQQHPFNNM